jgi:hypothetical protein
VYICSVASNALPVYNPSAIVGGAQVRPVLNQETIARRGENGSRCDTVAIQAESGPCFAYRLNLRRGGSFNVIPSALYFMLSVRSSKPEVGACRTRVVLQPPLSPEI